MTFLVRRAFESLVLFWLVVSLTFLLVHLVPGDPATLLVAPNANAEDIAALRKSLGLDANIAAQYVRWTARVLRGDLGLSFSLAEPVTTIVARSLPVSVALGLLSLALSFVAGVLIGFWQAKRAGSWPERIVSVIGLTAYAAPSFWVALGLVALFTYGASHFGWPAAFRLPAMGLRVAGTDTGGWAGLSDLARHAILPLSVLSLVGAAGIARYARAFALEQFSHDWVRTARAKGLSEGAVLYRHILANAAAPLIVLLALSLPGVVAGSVFVESIFAWPGMGRALLGAVGARDYPLVMGITLIYAAVVIGANWCADVAVTWVDPRRR